MNGLVVTIAFSQSGGPSSISSGGEKLLFSCWIGVQKLKLVYRHYEWGSVLRWKSRPQWV